MFVYTWWILWFLTEIKSWKTRACVGWAIGVADRMWRRRHPAAEEPQTMLKHVTSASQTYVTYFIREIKGQILPKAPELFMVHILSCLFPLL